LNRLSPDEHVLVGGTHKVDQRLEWDEVAKRIFVLTSEVLKKIGTDWSGWCALYRDPADGRLWEMVYPHGERQGGGSPELREISQSAAMSKYGLDGSFDGD
jgi:hypothetical protein